MLKIAKPLHFRRFTEGKEGKKEEKRLAGVRYG